MVIHLLLPITLKPTASASVFPSIVMCCFEKAVDWMLKDKLRILIDGESGLGLVDVQVD
jgi:hypothetical protein